MSSQVCRDRLQSPRSYGQRGLFLPQSCPGPQRKRQPDLSAYPVWYCGNANPYLQRIRLGTNPPMPTSTAVGFSYPLLLNYTQHSACQLPSVAYVDSVSSESLVILA